MEENERGDVKKWSSEGHAVIHFSFEKVCHTIGWGDLGSTRRCPLIPMPDFDGYEDVDMIVAKLPCGEKDVFRLQVHLVVANLAVHRGKWDAEGKMDVVFVTQCPPMIEIFRCDDVVAEDGDRRFYRPEKWRLEKKVAMPVGPCGTSMPLLWDDEVTGFSTTAAAKREAYATVLYSSENYVCGAMVVAQTLIRSGTKRDLILLHDDSISPPKLAALKTAGWKLRPITRIRNPKAITGSHNEYNYSKFRIWQLTEYDKVVYIDPDVVVLNNLDVLFNFPQLSAAWDQGSDSDIVFNSGVMVIEPSSCTLGTIMTRIDEINSCNGGDQGFLNEFYRWWHPLPSSVNLLTLFWMNSTYGIRARNRATGSVPESIHYYDRVFDTFWADSTSHEPKKVHAVHYLGTKPWRCYRDYNCNWDDLYGRGYADDVTHTWWWRVHDGMNDELKRFCGLTETRKVELEKMRDKARDLKFGDYHWRINVTDPRQFNTI
ncbi:hypothetical protein M569_01001 [Genlisea aurea]|uniref:Hexosyltransferase n=1 Tax=Genlisea aurea TaxID=192259 RepID=S8D2Y5_9LAMI|nr:hypothetical protein M569_01001 [Genlisea aurea]